MQDREDQMQLRKEMNEMGKMRERQIEEQAKERLKIQEEQ
jgi:hypothetical protein